MNLNIIGLKEILENIFPITRYFQNIVKSR